MKGYRLHPLTACTVCVVYLIALTGCWGGATVRSADGSPTLRDMPAAFVPPASDVAGSSLEEVAAGYRAALALIDAPAARQDILRRLALLELRGAEQQQVQDEKTAPADIYRDAIGTYKELLRTQRQREDNDRLLYPLAKAQEMSGDIDAALASFDRLVDDFPDSNYFSEAQFRRGEILFSYQRYAAAAAAYGAVVTRNEESPFLRNAWYMSGWAEFKLGRYRPALDAFVVVMDDYAKAPVARLNDQGSAAKTALLDDTYRVVALCFSYLDGPRSLAAMLDDQGEKPYVHRLYRDLGELYLTQKRYRDSAEVYGSFIERYPLSGESPVFHELAIDAFAAGLFPDDVREQKQQFAQRYAVTSDYWQQAEQSTRVFVKTRLREYINELAEYYHHLAQSQQVVLAKQHNDNKTQREGGNKKAVNQREVEQLFREAGDWYQRWIDSFPDEPDLAQSWFLLGETRYESTDYIAAINAYENAAYGYAAFEHSSEAGYAALLAYDHVIARTSQSEKGSARSLASDDVTATEPLAQTRHDWQQQKIASALLFASNFPDEPRRNAVLAQTTESLLALQEYQKTIDVAALLLADEALSAPMRFTAWISSAHASSALDAPADAEKYYGKALATLDPAATPELYQRHYSATMDNYAASIYQQGSVANAAGDTATAADTFLRVVELAPNSAIRVTAQHDASVLLMSTAQFERAIVVMADFARRFPDHAETKSVPARLLQAHQGMGDWQSAAEQATIIYQSDGDAVVRQEALLTAAELFDKSGDRANAIDKYRRYANNYPAPMAEQMEAQHRLAELYADAGDRSEREFWLKKMIASHHAATNKTSRSTWLAAFSQADLAETALLQYQSIELKHPLKQSLAKKRQAMDRTIDLYEKTANYGVESYTTQATQRIGQIYASLASALIASERPAALNALELEQYDFLLEEQAYPFEEQAIEIFTVNIERGWRGVYSEWVQESYRALAELLPARFDKREILQE